MRRRNDRTRKAARTGRVDSRRQEGEFVRRGRRAPLEQVRPGASLIQKPIQKPVGDWSASNVRPVTLRLAAVGVLLALLASAGCGASSHRAAASPAAERTPPAARGEAAGGQWPWFRGDPLASGVARTRLPDQPALLWRFEVKDGAFGATAAIVDGVVYIGDLDGALYALDLQTGRLRWKLTAGSGFVASPSVRDGRIYVGDYDGVFHCVTCEGKRKWSFQTEGEIDSSASFYRDRVLVGSQDATLYCLDAASGEEAWRYAIEDQIRCSPTVADDRTFLAGCDGRLHIIDLTRGQEAASVDLEGPTGVTPAVRGDLAFVGTEGGLFFGIDWKRAKVVWRYQSQEGGRSFRSSAAVADQAVVVGGRDRRVHAFLPDSGKPLWTFAAKGIVDSSPIIVGSRVFVGSSDGRIYGLSLVGGQEKWRYDAGGGFTGSPAAADGRLVIASDDGVVYCFGDRTRGPDPALGAPAGSTPAQRPGARDR